MTTDTLPTTPTDQGTGSPTAAAVAFEWLKLASVRSTWWGAAATVATAAVSALALGLSAAASAESGVAAEQAAPQVAAMGLLLAQLGLITVATLAITGEYSGGTIAVSLQAVPRRSLLLTAKAVVVSAFGAGLGVVTSVVATVVAVVSMGDRGLFTWSDAVLTTLGIGGWLAILGIVSLGLGTVLRSTAGTVTSLLLVLLAAPQLLMLMPFEWSTVVADHLPSTAATVVMSRVEDPYPVATALLVLVAWAAAILGAGRVALVGRDA